MANPTPCRFFHHFVVMEIGRVVEIVMIASKCVLGAFSSMTLSARAERLTGHDFFQLRDANAVTTACSVESESCTNVSQLHINLKIPQVTLSDSMDSIGTISETMSTALHLVSGGAIYRFTKFTVSTCGSDSGAVPKIDARHFQLHSAESANA